MSRTSTTLMEMYKAMLAHNGNLSWWPGETQLEICVGAILTQNTNWINVTKALANLSAAGAMSVGVLHKMKPQRLAELIKPAGYYNIKAKRLKNFIKAVYQSYGEDLAGFLNRSVSTLREELLAVNGIGRETADSIILYAALKRTFVVDAYTYRILLRHQIISREDDYETIKELMESALPQDVELYNDYHAQLVEVGKNHCRPKPICAGCPLEKFSHDICAGIDDY